MLRNIAPIWVSRTHVAWCRGALATINSVIANAACPERLLFHVPSLDAENRARWATSMQDTFENVHLYQYSKVTLLQPVRYAHALQVMGS